MKNEEHLSGLPLLLGWVIIGAAAFAVLLGAWWKIGRMLVRAVT